MFPNLGGLVYGVLVVDALLAAESARREGFPATIGAVALAITLYWLTHVYSDLTERRLEHSERLTLAAVARTLVQDLTFVAGAALPLLALLVSWAAGASLDTAVIAAIWTSAVVIVVLEVFAAVRAELTGAQLALQIVVGALFGVGVIVLRVILH